MGRLEPVDGALVNAFLGLADAVDAAPENAALWRQYREAEADVRRVGVAHDPDAVQALLDQIAGAAPVRDPSEG